MLTRFIEEYYFYLRPLGNWQSSCSGLNARLFYKATQCSSIRDIQEFYWQTIYILCDRA